MFKQEEKKPELARGLKLQPFIVEKMGARAAEIQLVRDATKGHWTIKASKNKEERLFTDGR